MRFAHVDAFVGDRARGNPAAVAVVNDFPGDSELNAKAQALGLPATVFVRPLGAGEFHVRWFTPVESDFCGHGTLATAHVLFESGGVSANTPIRFQSRAGPLVATRNNEWIQLDLPALPVSLATAKPELAAALGASPINVATAEGRVLVELESEHTVRSLQPNVEALRALYGQPVIVTARAAAPYDFVSRYFRKAGDLEDPVTGSAHCALAPYWVPRLRKNELLAFQASERGGVLRLHLHGARISVAGRAQVTRQEI